MTPVEETGARALTVTDVEWSPRRVTARFETGDRIHPIGIEASEDLARAPDPFLPLGLLPAMSLGVPLRIPGGVSGGLLDSIPRAQEILRLWEDGLRIVRVEADRRREGGPTGTGVGVLFSGGVDSFYTLLERRDEITDLIFVLGLDIPLRGRDQLLRRASEMAHEVAGALGKRLIEVRADVRSFSDTYVRYFYYYGSALAAIALLFQHRLRAVLVPAGQSYAHLHRDGSHPLLDPLWSTEGTKIVPDGAEARRTEKVAALASSELAMRWLRVCLANPEGAYNCGRCEKCLRTLVNLRVVGAEGRCRTLPSRLDLRRVRRMPLVADSHRDYALESLHAVEASGSDPRLASALRFSLGRSALRAALKGFAPAPLLRAVRRRRAG